MISTCKDLKSMFIPWILYKLNPAEIGLKKIELLADVSEANFHQTIVFIKLENYDVEFLNNFSL